jgi:hypothetical protein
VLATCGTASRSSCSDAGDGAQASAAITSAKKMRSEGLDGRVFRADMSAFYGVVPKHVRS